MLPSDIHPLRLYANAGGELYLVDRVESGTVTYRADGAGTPMRMELDAFASLVKFEAEKQDRWHQSKT